MKTVENGYAKINLSLDVLRKRPDGYHDVSMIMQTIGLFDTITVETNETGDVRLKTDSGLLPTDGTNLACKAAEAFRKHFEIETGVDIELTKRIPVAAGLAGGSTDAAAVLRAMNRLFEKNASLEELCKIGVKIGADVPFCICGGTMLSEGIGELLTPIESKLSCSVVLVKPSFPVSTKYVYENLRLSDAVHPDIAKAQKATEDGDIAALAATAGNILESVTCKKYPELEEIKAELRGLGADLSLMSGSGPTVFALFEDETQARTAFESFKTGPYSEQTFITRLGKEE